jgi:hypothetical protein
MWQRGQARAVAPAFCSTDLYFHRAIPIPADVAVSWPCRWRHHNTATRYSGSLKACSQGGARCSFPGRADGKNSGIDKELLQKINKIFTGKKCVLLFYCYFHLIGIVCLCKINTTHGGFGKLRETKMRQFTISAAAAMAFAALLASVPAQAETLGGGPKQAGNQCFKYSMGQERDGRFGTWGACPKPASTATAPSNTRGRSAASR